MNDILKMPQGQANDSPELAEQWLKYWHDVSNIKPQSNAEYRKAYYHNKNMIMTRQRQIAKLHTLMDKYPAEAAQHVYKAC